MNEGGFHLVSKTNDKHIYIKLLSNKSLLSIWSGQTFSIIGDAFFDLAIMWVVYSQSQSIFLSSLVGVLFHLSSALLSPIAGVLADRFDRKKMIIITNILSAFVVLIVSLTVFIMGYLPTFVALLAIVLLNGLTAFLYPAESSILPDIVGPNLLSSAYGMFTTISNSAALIGSAVAGLFIAGVGAGWAFSIDSLSFIIVAFFIAVAKIPKRQIDPNLSLERKKSSFWIDMVNGWNYIKGFPIMKSFVWLTLLSNIPSFIGSLYPPLVAQQLNGEAGTLGFLEAAGVIGAIFGGIIVGSFERRFGSGRLIVFFWFVVGLCTIGIGLSTSTFLSLVLLFLRTLSTTMASVCIFTVQMALISENFRGRVNGVMRSFAVIAIPISTLIAGGLGEIVGITTLFIISGIWSIGVGFLALTNSHIRKVKVGTKNIEKNTEAIEQKA